MMERVVRKSLIAGSWYSGNPELLRKDIETYLDNVHSWIQYEKVVALISPHAGYAYSGQVAAHAYKSIEGKRFDTVVVIGPSHRAFFRGASLYDGVGYETPLGIVYADIETAQEIQNQSGMISFIPDAHRQEHSVEIQLPFLQVVLGEFGFVPVVMGAQDEKTCRELATALVKVLKGREALIVGSSDLSHFRGYNKTVKMDGIVLEHIRKMDPDGLLKELGKGSCEACGGGPIVATMMAAKMLGAEGSTVLNYANSGDVSGERDKVVGYASAVFYLADPDKKQAKEILQDTDSGLSKADRDMLLKIARDSIESKLTGGMKPEINPQPEALKKKAGAFVTIKKRGKLRGCIGHIRPIKPLHETVSEMAEAAAFDDPRFPPLEEKEAVDLTVEISVLTALKEIKSSEDIVVGRHGIYLVRGFRSGLLLPQVATDYNWDRLTFLEQTCQKAGLPSNAWREKGTKVYIFSADVFGEEK